MKTFAFDEYGVFENDNTVSFVAGFIYDDMGDLDDAINERKRIEGFYKNAMKKTGLKDLEYPKSLHLSQENEKDTVYKVKSEVNKGLIDFVRGSGQQTYNTDLPERKGTYHIYVMYKGNSAICNLSDRDNVYRNESFSNNLYLHMVDKLLTFAVFENPDNAEDTYYQLLVPTRSVRVEAGSQKQTEFKETGYRTYSNDKNKNSTSKQIRYAVMDKVAYNTLFQEKTKSYDLDFEAKVGDYHYDISGDAFFFLADSVCTFLSQKAYRSDLGKMIKVLPPEQSTIFAYDSGSLMPFSHVVKKYMGKDFFAMFSHMYTIEQMKDDPKDPIVQYYKSKIFPRICAAAEKADFVYWKETVRKLNEKLLSNRYNNRRGIYIFEKTKLYVNNLKSDQTVDSKFFFEFYKSGLSVYNHQAASGKALECFKECLSYGTAMELAPIINRYIVALIDGFEWGEAEKVALNQVNNCIQLKKMKYDISALSTNQSEKSNNEDMAKAYSQYAQVLAFERKREETAAYFIKSLDCYSEPSVNYYITLSYYLHFLIDSSEKELYEKWAPRFFGSKTSVLEQLDEILKDGNITNPERSFPFAMYVYIKGVYVFYRDSMSREELEKIIKQIKPAIDKLQSESKDSHPNQFILYYCILLLQYIQMPCEEEIIALGKMAARSTKKSGLLSAIKFNCLIRCKKALGIKNEDLSSEYNAIRSAIKSIPKFCTLDLKTQREVDEFTEKYLTYMYC